MTEMINEQENFVSLKEKSIKKEGTIKKAKNKTQRNQILEAREGVIKNAIKMYDKRANIIDAFVNEDITTKNPKAKLYDDPEELESKLKFEESIAERTKMRREKSDEENREGQGLKILTPNRMLSRLSISLAQLKAGNNSE